MLLFGGAFGVLAFAVWVFCIIDVVTTPEGTTRTLPKLVWLLIVIFLLDIGSIAWLVAGRPWSQQPRVPARTPGRATNPDDDEEFLAELRVRAEEQRRRAREAQREDDPPSA